jgi:hypothetical protein
VGGGAEVQMDLDAHFGVATDYGVVIVAGTLFKCTQAGRVDGRLKAGRHFTEALIVFPILHLHAFFCCCYSYVRSFAFTKLLT